MCAVIEQSQSHPTPTPKLSKKKKSARSKSKQDTYLVKSKRNRDIYTIFCPKSKRNWCLPILLWFYYHYHFSPPDSTSTPPSPPPHHHTQPQSNAIIPGRTFQPQQFQSSRMVYCIVCRYTKPSSLLNRVPSSHPCPRLATNMLGSNNGNGLTFCPLK